MNKHENGQHIDRTTDGIHRVDKGIKDAVLNKLPDFVFELWKDGIDVLVGGSFMRLGIHGDEKPNDIDLYGSMEVIKAVRERYAVIKEGVYSVDLDVPGCPIKVNLADKLWIDTRKQSVTDAYLHYVDFSISGAVLHVERHDGKMHSVMTAIGTWEKHVAEKRIVFIKGDEHSHNSLARVLKLYRIGYTISPVDFSMVIGAFMNGMDMRSAVSNDGRFVNNDQVLDVILHSLVYYDPASTKEDIADVARS